MLQQQFNAIMIVMQRPLSGSPKVPKPSIPSILPNFTIINPLGKLATMGATRLHKIPLRFNPATSRYIYKCRKQVKQANYKSDATCM